MKLLLDTTYLLPAIGISIKGLPGDALIKLINRGDQVSICDITIFELAAKGGKYIASGTLSPDRVSRGIRSIIYDGRIARIPIHDSSILLVAFKLRGMLRDFIDCLILSSAINQNDVLVTEDERIQRLKERRDFRDFIESINPHFRIQTLADTL